MTQYYYIGLDKSCRRACLLRSPYTYQQLQLKNTADPSLYTAGTGSRSDVIDVQTPDHILRSHSLNLTGKKLSLARPLHLSGKAFFDASFASWTFDIYTICEAIKKERSGISESMKQASMLISWKSARACHPTRTGTYYVTGYNIPDMALRHYSSGHGWDSPHEKETIITWGELKSPKYRSVHASKDKSDPSGRTFIMYGELKNNGKEIPVVQLSIRGGRITNCVWTTAYDRKDEILYKCFTAFAKTAAIMVKNKKK